MKLAFDLFPLTLDDVFIHKVLLVEKYSSSSPLMGKIKSNGDANGVLKITRRRRPNVRIRGEKSPFFEVKWAARSGVLMWGIKPLVCVIVGGHFNPNTIYKI
ncbi:hypothetical protein D3C87_1423040 [compost metagenome]